MKGLLCAALFLVQCAPRSFPIADPSFNMRVLGPNVYAITADSLNTGVEQMACGVLRDGRVTECVVGHGGEVLVLHQEPWVILIQVPMKSLRQLHDEIGCGLRYLCTVDVSKQRIVIHKKKS